MATGVANGTTTPTLNVESTLNGGSFTAAGTYVCQIDTSNLVNGDMLELRVYAKVLTGGAEKLVYYAAYANAQSAPVKVTIPHASLYSVSFRITQTAGTARAFDWQILTL